MPRMEFNFADGKSGRIEQIGLGYSAFTGHENCWTGQNTPIAKKWRAYFSFDTSSLPDDAQVTKVEFWQRLAYAQPAGNPETLSIKYSVGTFIGAALNGNAGEWNGGTVVLEVNEEFNGVWVELEGAHGYVNLSGDTDLKVWDDSYGGGGSSSWGTDFNRPSDKCRLRVTYAPVGLDAASAQA